MDKLNDSIEQDVMPGVIRKSASVHPLQATEDDLAKINQYTLSPLTAEDVFVFKVTMGDNEQDDRNDMPFDLAALQDLKQLYPGKTMIKDHRRSADNQVARVYDTELVTSDRKTALGEKHTELDAKVYMVKTESNRDLIAEIKGGIKKEVSTSTVPKRMICNICGTDNIKKWCIHYPGQTYTIKDDTPNGTKKRCQMLLSGAEDAHELSFVAVPAQRRAGTHKSIDFIKPVPEDIQPETEMRVKIAESYIFSAKKEEQKA